MLLEVLFLAVAYLLGSVPSAVWVGRLTHGLDVREHGSGNAGATNVFRVLGWKLGLLVLLLDVLKGWLAAGPVADALVGGHGLVPGTEAAMPWQLACGVLAIVGHTFPVFAGFRGGKGVATTAGVLLALTPGALGITVASFAVVFGLTRYVALGSLTAAVVYPATLYAMRFGSGREVPTTLLVVGTLMGAWLFWTHRTNIRRLLRGEEKRLTSGRPVRGMD